MFKRVIYLSLSVISLLSMVSLFFYLPLVVSVASSMVLITLISLYTMFVGIYYDTLSTPFTFILGIFTLKRKRIYFDNLGYFWISYSNGGQLIVSKQKLFVLFEIYRCHHDGLELDELVIGIKNGIELYNKKNNIGIYMEDPLKNWNGIGIPTNILDKSNRKIKKL